MGQNAAETVREIEEIRGRLTTDLHELQDRLPAPALWGKRLLGIALGGGVATWVLLFAIRRRRSKAAKRRPQSVDAVIQLLPEDVARRVVEQLEDDRLKRWLAGAGAAWLLLRLAELRQLRRMRAASGG